MMRALLCWGTMMVWLGAEPEKGHVGLVTDLVGDGEKVYSCSRGGVFSGEGTKLQKQWADLTDHATGLAWGTRDERKGLYVVGGEPGVAGTLLWVGETGMWLETLRDDLGEDLCYDIARSNAGVLAVGRGDGRVDLLNGDGQELRVGVHKHSGPVRAVAYSPDGKWLASAGRDGLLKLSAIENPANVVTLVDHTAGVESLAFSPDSRFLASGSRDAKVRLYGTDGVLVRTYQGLGMAEEPVAGRVVAHVLSLTWKGEYLVAGTSNGKLFQLSRTDAQFTALKHQVVGPVTSLLIQEGKLLVGSKSRISQLPVRHKKGASQTADP